MKHKLSKRDQARGVRKALRSRKTPSWLKPSMRAYLRKLEARINARRRAEVGNQSSGQAGRPNSKKGGNQNG